MYIVIVIVIIIICIAIFEYSFFTNINFHKFAYPKLYRGVDLNVDTNISIDKLIKSKRKAKNKKIVICGLCRNIEKQLLQNIKKIEFTGKLFKEYKIILFENDSHDNTRKVIREWSDKNKNVILLEYSKLPDSIQKYKINFIDLYDTGVFSKYRMKKMAYYRNLYLNYVKIHFSHYDYMFVLDIDFEGLYSNDGLLDSIGYNNWDMIGINGRFQCPGMFGITTVAYDSIAFVGQKDDFKKTINILQSITNGIKMNYIISNNNNKLIPVRSTFNGAAIYKIDSVLDSQYDSEYCCEHVDFHKSMISNNHNLLFINPNFLGYMGLQGPRENILSIFKSII